MFFMLDENEWCHWCASATVVPSIQKHDMGISHFWGSAGGAVEGRGELVPGRVGRVVFESPVRSGFLTPRVIDWDRDRSFEIEIGQKTGPNRYGPVFCGLLQLQDRSKPVMVQTGPKPV